MKIELNPSQNFENMSLADGKVREDPYAYYRLMQEKFPVFYDERVDLYLIVNHDLITEAAKNTEVFSSAIDMRREVGGPDPAESDALFEKEGYVVPDVLSQVDAPQHTYFRSLVERLFTRPIVEDMNTYIEEHVNELVDAFIDDGKVEFFGQFAVPLPLGVIADQLGVPRADAPQLKRWTDSIIDTLGIMLSAEEKLAATRQIIEFQHYFVDKLSQKEKSPAGDIISKIAAARLEPDNRSLTVEEKLALIQQLLVAGNETTRNHLAKCLYLLTQFPQYQPLLRSDISLIENFVEEALRYESPVQGVFRRVTKSIRFGGVDIPMNAKAMLMYGAGNRDERLFEGPSRFNPRRPNSRRHLAFGRGKHMCIGSMLARKELNVALEVLLTRMQDIRLADGHEPIQHLSNIMLRGMAGRLDLVFKPA